jgi:excisionase family DNA binding protein
MTTDTIDAPALLLGAGAIARYLGISKRQVYRLIEQDQLETFRMGKTIAARPQRLLQALDARISDRPPAGGK